MYGEANLSLWLASLPMAVSVPLILGLGVMLSAGGTYVVHRIYAFTELEPNNLVGAAKYSFLGEVYAVTLGLVLIGAWSNYVDARDNIQREAATLAFLKQAATSYSEPDQLIQQAEMRNTVRQYARAVVEKEWRIMSLGQPSLEVTTRFERMADAFLKINPLTEGQMALQQNTVAWIADINEYRAFRLTTISRSLIGLVWGLVLFGTFIAIAFPWYFGTTRPFSQGTMSAIVSAFLMAHLLVVLKLAHPFVGETGVTPEPFLAIAQ